MKKLLISLFLVSSFLVKAIEIKRDEVVGGDFRELELVITKTDAMNVYKKDSDAFIYRVGMDAVVEALKADSKNQKNKYLRVKISDEKAALFSVIFDKEKYLTKSLLLEKLNGKIFYSQYKAKLAKGVVIGADQMNRDLLDSYHLIDWK